MYGACNGGEFKICIFCGVRTIWTSPDSLPGASPVSDDRPFP